MTRNGLRNVAIVSMALLTLSALNVHAADPVSVEYQQKTYVAIRSLAAMLDGTADFTSPQLPLGMQPIAIEMSGNSWKFLNGGDRIRTNTGREQPLNRPLIVYGNSIYA